MKDIARIAGYLISMTIALRPIARLFTRHVYFVISFIYLLFFVISCRRSWHDHIVVSEQLAQELKFWLQHIDAFNGYAIKRKFSAMAVAYSDASDSGFGGLLALIGSYVSCGQWSEFEVAQSSTYRELKATLYVLQSFYKVLSHRKVKWFSDSQNMCRIVSVDSPKPELQSIAVSIFQVCMSFDIAIDMEWLPRCENERADYISRIADLDEWLVNPSLFHLVDSHWGPHTVALFASYDNAQVERFNSRFG